MDIKHRSCEWRGRGGARGRFFKKKEQKTQEIKHGKMNKIQARWGKEIPELYVKVRIKGKQALLEINQKEIHFYIH